jgi:hypothetical protein
MILFLIMLMQKLVVNLPVSSVSANGNDGNVPQNVVDNNLNTRWSKSRDWFLDPDGFRIN